jgi:uncharacterized protein YhhL (DUF1145 family)
MRSVRNRLVQYIKEKNLSNTKLTLIEVFISSIMNLCFLAILIAEMEFSFHENNSLLKVFMGITIVMQFLSIMLLHSNMEKARKILAEKDEKRI